MEKKQFGVGIIGTGAYVPEQVVTNQDFEKRVDTSDEWIVSRTGIKERRFAPEGVATSDLAVEASLKAIANAGITVEEIGLIIVATVTPDMFFPSTACLVQEKIGAKNAFAFDISAACSGFVYGLSIANQYIKNGTTKYALVIGAEALSRIINPEDRSTVVLFGDGAGAAVLGPCEQGGLLSFELGSDGSGGDLLCVEGGGSKCPATIESVEAKKHYITMAGTEVYKFAVNIMGETSLKALEKANLTKEDVDYFVPHQANIRIVNAAAKRLGISNEKVYINLDRYGNMSAASIPVALDEAARGNKIADGDIIVLVGFGAGLTWGACVLSWQGK